jgi:hypothetical protein
MGRFPIRIVGLGTVSLSSVVEQSITPKALDRKKCLEESQHRWTQSSVLQNSRSRHSHSHHRFFACAM